MPEGPRHTYAYSLDMGRALVNLALSDDCLGEEYHLPVGTPVTVSEMAALFNRAMGSSYRVIHIPDLVLRGLGLVQPLIREVQEMSYQYKTDYIMSDAKFRERFPDFRATSYEDGVAAMVEYFRK
jgi:nucleoside-diphosphate-sugar epimerase